MQEKQDSDTQDAESVDASEFIDTADNQAKKAIEYGGPKGKEPTRYGDWEKNGRCIDF
ncbi:MAG: DUF1674 domain-containing protein [Gammaproteobacteria bacterium]|nr:DUF1674 domain-containing protein [Gammaproteobacteria bacterium]